jgi:hypothetical protein
LVVRSDVEVIAPLVESKGVQEAVGDQIAKGIVARAILEHTVYNMAAFVDGRL